nr:immunoglobulin light chain junction region [Homo sapiens]MCD01426.1 immunoglobulin light chain junction region [Homo sapiens]
CQQYDNLPP